jgi:phage terminase Nu1 subunit (DNA packaging protein)
MAGKDSESVLKKVVTLSDVAALTVQSERSVQRQVKAGVLRLAKDREGRQLKGRFVLGDCIPKICEHLRDLATADDPAAPVYAAARARRMEASAAMTELELRLRKTELHRSEDVQFVVGMMLTNARDRLRAIPSRVMHPLQSMTDPVAINQLVQGEIDAILTELSETDLAAKFHQETKQYLAGQLGCSEAQVESAMSANGEEPQL